MDSQVRAVRLLPVQAPDRAAEERDAVAALNEQLSAARNDAARLVDLLAEAYATHARKSADAELRREELAVALKEIERLQRECADARASAHELKKQHGELTSRVATLQDNARKITAARDALLDELNSANQQVAEHVQRAGASADMLAAAHKRSADAVRAMSKAQSALQRARNEFALERSEWQTRQGNYQSRIDLLASEIAENENALRASEAALKSRVERSRLAEKEAREEAQALMQRFITFVNEAAQERRSQAQLLSELIDEAQRGLAWRLKRLLGNPWRK